MENPIKMDDLGVPLFSETPIYTWWQIYSTGQRENNKSWTEESA